MYRPICFCLSGAALLFLLTGCFQKEPSSTVNEHQQAQMSSPIQLSGRAADIGLTPAEITFTRELIQKYKWQTPYQWGERVSGVKRKMQTSQPVVALTFDACGGPGGSGYDHRLIEYLIRENIPATLFINSRWIDENRDVFLKLARNPLFEIENHGHLHRPLSVNGRSAWGIAGTQNISQVVDEVMINERKIAELTGRKPIYFRSGTAYYDNVAARVVEDLGLLPVNFDVLGDAGATFSAEQIRQAFLTSVSGSIIICHMNHPEKHTAEGVMLGVPELRKRGFRFVKVDTYPLE
ncbi:polysaccharide deacetylase family protein [Paenibacillus filicis]|uniref:Polysaccharide deacetylase family protein n=1 Tax=Paenibacillus gyeongsangnamensis TaxID=3388067 RepID=A0ABT4QAP0_9BACL|nr:polysaccharide deacetylase family protein [Paenibacillus filicis]MCZ8513947.1 polysaccharide deacetylase family protein [Paenibacillus filicis]